MNTASPQTYTTEHPLLGHEPIEQRLLADWNSGRAPHAYLFTGRRGIGKTTMAYRLAQFILNQSEAPAEPAGLFGDALPAAVPDSLASNSHSPTSLRMQAGTHSGFMFLQPLYDEKKGKFKDEISVDQVRKITIFASQTAGEGNQKIILIEPAEAMNSAAANALLKWLEEPPSNTYFILVSHNPSRLLPTIRSRCRRLSFAPLTSSQCSQIMEQKGNAITSDAELLTYLAGGSAGILSEMMESQVENVFQELLDILVSGGSESVASYRFSESLPKRISWENWYVLMSELMSLIIKDASGIPAPGWFTASYPEAVPAISARLSVENWILCRDRLIALHRDTEQLYLDRKHVVMQMIDLLAGKTTTL